MKHCETCTCDENHGWVVVNNLTSAVISRTYETEEKANWACRNLNAEGISGMYGVKPV